MKELTREQEVAILIKDGCTKIEAENYLKEGAMIYGDDEKETFIEIKTCCDNLTYDAAVIEWSLLNKINYEDNIYRVDYM